MTDSRWNQDSTGRVSFPPISPDRCYVYVAWGADRSRPLYVGKARKPWARFMFHMANTTWAAEVLEWECDAFATESHAEYAEIEAIHDLNPTHNVMRRLTQAEWAEHHLQFDEKQRLKDEARERARQKLLGRQRPKAKKKPAIKVLKAAPLPEPAVKKRVRSIRWKAELFTEDQLEIIRRVQNRGRAA